MQQSNRCRIFVVITADATCNNQSLYYDTTNLFVFSMMMANDSTPMVARIVVCSSVVQRPMRCMDVVGVKMKQDFLLLSLVDFDLLVRLPRNDHLVVLILLLLYLMPQLLFPLGVPPVFDPP